MLKSIVQHGRRNCDEDGPISSDRDRTTAQVGWSGLCTTQIRHGSALSLLRIVNLNPFREPHHAIHSS